MLQHQSQVILVTQLFSTTPICSYIFIFILYIYMLNIQTKYQKLHNIEIIKYFFIKKYMYENRSSHHVVLRWYNPLKLEELWPTCLVVLAISLF